MTECCHRAIAGAAFVLGRRALVDWPTVAVAGVTFGLLTRFKKLQEALVVLIAGAAGIAFKGSAAT